MQRSRGPEGLVTELLSPRFVTIQWLCCQLCFVTAANRRTIVEIALLATVSWTCGCQPFSCRCSQHAPHCRKEICWTCLFQESNFSYSFLEFQASTPYQKLEVPESRVRSAISALNHGCIMPIPSLQLQKKPVICREAEGLVTELWSPRFVTIQWLCCHLCYVTVANQRTIVEIQILATVSWTCGCQPFSCRCSQHVTHCPKEICWTCLFKESMPFLKSKPPLPTRSLGFLRAAYVPPSLH